MINNLLTFLNYENIYLTINWGVIPFWLLLIFLPHNQITNFLVQSVIVPLLLAAGYIYLAYGLFKEGDIFDGFELYKPHNESIYSICRNRSGGCAKSVGANWPIFGHPLKRHENDMNSHAEIVMPRPV